MHELFTQTKLTKKGVAKNSGFLDWNTQPTRFKRYPEFSFRYTKETLGEYAWLLSLREITDTHLIAKKPYHRLNTPSAGNLHPIEIYLQIRNIKGILSGIYHLDVAHQELVLIRDIEKDGIESYVGIENRFRGILIVTSLVPFRSFWKYGLRSWRYLYLDAGHQMATMYALLQSHKQSPTILSDFDSKALNDLMGFEDKEFTCKVIALGTSSEKPVETISSPLMHVLPTDYSEPMEILNAQLASESKISNTVIAMPECIRMDLIPSLMRSRRSAREFSSLSLQKAQIEQFMNIFNQSDSIQATVIMMRGEDYESGIYKENQLVRRGFFTSECSDLLVGQRFISFAALVVALHVKLPDNRAHIEAGIVSQWIYLFAQDNGIGCSGIGAYYDDALRSFLDIDDEIVYVIALGAQ
ncbi:MAG: SagB family peptide dehydrogenase [Campylobacterota bacterium]|nr:SagB family peptide dehydrogenase [Campylobacterota bacterium]